MAAAAFQRSSKVNSHLGFLFTTLELGQKQAFPLLGMKSKHFLSPLFGSSSATPAGETARKAHPHGSLCRRGFELVLPLSDLIASCRERKNNSSNF